MADSELSVVFLGESGAGKSTLVSNLFQVPTHEVTDTVGLHAGRLKNARAELKKISEHLGGKWDLLLFCISVHVPSRFKDGNPRIMKTLQKCFGKNIWKSSALVLTFSNTVRDWFFNNKSREDAVRLYKAHLSQYAADFETELKNLGNHDVMVITAFTELEQPSEKQIILPAIPAGYKKYDIIFEHQDWLCAWRDIFIEKLKYCNIPIQHRRQIPFRPTVTVGAAVFGMPATIGRLDGLGVLGGMQGAEIGAGIAAVGRRLGATVGGGLGAGVGAWDGAGVGLIGANYAIGQETKTGSSSASQAADSGSIPHAETSDAHPPPDGEKQRHMEAYKKAIKDNVPLEICPVRFNYIGLPRSGKSSFRRRLTREISNILEAIARGEKEQPSTGVAEAGGQVFIRNETTTDIGTITSQEWTVLKDLEDEAGMFGQIIYNTVTLRKETSTAERMTQTPAGGAADPGVSTGASTPLKPSASKRTDMPTASKWSLLSLKEFLLKVRRAIFTRARPSTTNSEIEEMFSVINNAINAKHWDKVKNLLDDLILLITTDTGGQAEFLDLQASLVQGPSFNLLFSRLVDELESQFEVYYTNEEGESTEKEDSIMTTEQVLFQCLSSIACYSGTFSDGDNTPSGEASASKTSKSKVMFVGTHRDLVTQEKFEEKDKLLQEKIKSTPFYKKGIIKYATEDQLMLPVDNMRGGQDEMDRIREILEKAIKESFEKVEIPASWLVLSLQMRAKRMRTMRLEECEELARKVKISPSELQDALWFLHHHVGVLLYYPELEALKGTVICDIQVVYDSATNLIKNVFTFDKVGQSVSEKFREKAQFSLKDVQKATSGHTDALIPLNKLVQLLEYLGILTIIDQSQSRNSRPTYFMPCVLKTARANELRVHSCGDLDPAPLMIRYDCGFVPVGMFPSMITNLVSQKLKGWKMLEECLRKNRVQFLVGEDYDTVTLISRPRYLEIVISRTETFQGSTESLCSHVRSVIQSTLSIATSRMNYHFSMGYKFGFECLTHPGREHLCVLAHERARKMECLQDEREIIPLQPQHQMWFSGGQEGILLSMSTLILFKWRDKQGCEKPFRLVDRVRSRWMEFGLSIGLHIDRLEAWEKQYQNDAARCWQQVMSHWLKAGGTSDYPATWDGLCTLLVDIKCPQDAEELKAALDSPAHPNLANPSHPTL